VQDDDGFILYESRAISRYIAAKAGSSLLPTGDAKKVGLFEQAVSIETSNFDPHASGITVQRVFTPMMGGKPDEERVKGYSTTLEKNLATYNQILSKQKYLAGNELTLADLFHLSYGVFLAPQQFTWLEDEAKYPHLARYVPFVSSSIIVILTSGRSAGGRRSPRARRGPRSRTASPGKRVPAAIECERQGSTVGI
jgi:glutathione S-transferase